MIKNPKKIRKLDVAKHLIQSLGAKLASITTLVRKLHGENPKTAPEAAPAPEVHRAPSLPLPRNSGAGGHGPKAGRVNGWLVVWSVEHGNEQKQSPIC